MGHNSEIDLEVIPTNDLVSEILRRFDHGIVAAMKVNELGENTHGYYIRWEGNTHTCIGLSVDIQHWMLGSMARTRQSP